MRDQLSQSSRQLAIIIPCYNESLTIGKVVRDFRSVLPHGVVFVYDNNSQDDTASRAREAGAIVQIERHRGKGNVVRRMFAEIDADVYVLVDGDDTYDPASAAIAVSKLLEEGLDFINVARQPLVTSAYRFGHAFGNKLLTSLVRIIFGSEFNDMLSGLKIFSRRFVKSFPGISRGFEIETELTIHALELRMPVYEFEAPFRTRAEGSVSKLKTFGDGLRILGTIVRLIRHERPLNFYGTIGLASIAAAVLLSVPLVVTFFETGLVPRVPTAILAVGLVLVGSQSIAVAAVLDTVTRSRQEIKRLAYLQTSGPIKNCGASWPSQNVCQETAVRQ